MFVKKSRVDKYLQRVGFHLASQFCWTTPLLCCFLFFLFLPSLSLSLSFLLSLPPFSFHLISFQVGYTGSGATCSQCPVNTYKTAPGSAACSSCPAGTTTDGLTGATAVTQCICRH